MEARAELLTVGHSTHPIVRFLELLRGAGVELLADVRRYPASRRNPQFGAAALSESLAQTGIGYLALGDELGGRRAGSGLPGGSPNLGWRNESFRAYADHMGSAGFGRGIERLIAAASGRRTAVMCAEAHPSRCHRKLIADALLARAWRVVHLLADGRLVEHELTPFAVVTGTTVTYPAQPRLDV